MWFLTRKWNRMVGGWGLAVAGKSFFSKKKKFFFVSLKSWVAAGGWLAVGGWRLAVLEGHFTV